MTGSRWLDSRRRGRRRRILIIVENSPVPRDQRVWKECLALSGAGYSVSVIAPRGPGQPRRDDLGGIRIHRFPATRERAGLLGFVFEFGWAWLHTLALTTWVFARDGFAAIQACNPPDIFFTVAAPYKLAGCPFVFDQHDLSPELYTARYGRSDGLVFRCLELLEAATFRVADHVIAMNPPQERIALGRGRKPRAAVTIVANGPVLTDFASSKPRPELRRGKRFLCCWVGAMGAVDDGVDLGVRAIAHLVHDLGRDDCHFAFLGDGEAFDDVTRLAGELGLAEHTTFTGWAEREVVLAFLASADVGLQPDPKNPRTDLATAVKTMEYMAAGLPVVAFDLDETRRMAGDAAVYAEANDPISFAKAIDGLLSDPDRRRAMGAAGREAVERELAWEHQRARYVRVFERLIGT